MYTIVLDTSAKKDLRKIPVAHKTRIRGALHSLSMNPYVGKKLQGEHEGFRSVRVWPYRVLYAIQKEIITVTVIAIGHRQGVYKLKGRA